MSISQSNGKYPGWIDEFISAFSRTAGTVKADININDLDEIIWNDEKYRVMFDENGANIINEFGNTVTSLEGVKSLQEVDERLNKKQVVTESINISNEIEAEINEVMKYMNDEPVDIEVEQPTPQSISASDPITAPYPSKEEIAELVASKTTAILNEKFADFEDKMNTKFDESKFEPLENKSSNDDDEEFDPMKDIMYDDPVDEQQTNEPNMKELEQKITDIIDSKINYMVNEVINQVTQKLSQLQIPSQDVMDIEKQQYDKSADETMKQINNENNTDRTTPEGFYNNHKENITDDELDGLDDTLVPNNNEPVDKGVEIPTEEEIDKEVQEEIENDPDIPDMKEQKPHRHEKPHHEGPKPEHNEEPLDAESEVDPLIKFRKCKCPMETEADIDPLMKLRKVKEADYEDDLTPSKIDDFSPNGQSQQSEQLEQPQDPQQQMQQEQDNIQNVQSQNQQNEVLGSDAEIFKTATCPFCANKLYTESKNDEFLNISCGSCNTKYKVNLNNEKIYIR